MTMLLLVRSDDITNGARGGGGKGIKDLINLVTGELHYYLHDGIRPY